MDDRRDRLGYDDYGVPIPPGGRYFLHRLNPLAKVAAGLPATLILIGVRDVITPASFAVAAVAILLVGARLSKVAVLMIVVGMPLVTMITSVTFGLWVTPAGAPGAVLFSIGGYRFTFVAWQIGLATALRFGAIISITLISGLTTTGPDLVRALIQQLHLPYRIGYAALAAGRFVPRFSTELDTIRAAHRVRGIAGRRGLIATSRAYLGYTVPLLAGAIRHAERVALAMDARAFGAHARRTERRKMRFTWVDATAVVIGWLITTAIMIICVG